MPARKASYDYALIRVVPRVERGERMNVGVVLFCRTRAYLGARIKLDEARLLAFFPAADTYVLASAEKRQVAGKRVTIKAATWPTLNHFIDRFCRLIQPTPARSIF
jgi:hypothetical protein